MESKLRKFYLQCLGKRDGLEKFFYFIMNNEMINLEECIKYIIVYRKGILSL